jgi:hypothetical protein
VLSLHRKKSFSIFPSPAGLSLTKLSLSAGIYDVIYKLFLPRESLVSEIPAGDGNIESFFYGVDISVLQQTVLPLDVSISTMHVLPFDVSVLQQHALTLKLSVLCCL